MQNLITQLLEPSLGETKPSTLKRRAAEQLAQLIAQQGQDQLARLRLEHEAQVAEYFKNLDHQAEYRRAYNLEQNAQFN